jgi:hypothetical protein
MKKAQKKKRGQKSHPISLKDGWLTEFVGRALAEAMVSRFEIECGEEKSHEKTPDHP